MNNHEFEKLSRAYADLTVKHPKQNEALERAMFLLTKCINVDFVVAAGPTGAGKSHLLKRLIKTLDEFYKPQVLETPSMVPCLSTLAVADGAKKFAWKRLWLDGSKGLGDPFANARSWRTSGAASSRLAKESFTTSVARDEFEMELQKRGTRIWAIDEAQHLLLGGSAGASSDQFDVLKSVSQVTALKLVLCGTYQLPRMLGNSGQVMRRSATVTLAPYSINVQSEVNQFAGVCSLLLQHLPGDHALDAIEVIEPLFVGSLGCVGVLKDWIARAWAHSYFKRRRLTIDDFNETRLSFETLLSMQEEIKAGEAMNSASAEALYRSRILESRKVRADMARNAVHLTAGPVGTSQANCADKSRNPKRRVGERLPGRDPVKTAVERAQANGGSKK
jgi:energy-coupling factor transporter ATP-binding protein EcfA2